MSPEQRSQALHDGEDAALALEKLPLGPTRQSIMDAWAKAENADVREQLWHELKALERITGRLWSMINGAKSAAYEIKQDEMASTQKKADPYERA